MATKQVSAPPPEPEPTEEPTPSEYPEDAPAAVPPLDPFSFDQSATWDPSYRSMLDAPGHPLGHLKGA